MHIYINKNKLFIDHYKIKCSIGKRGIKIKKKEGDKITPKGNFKIKHIFYRKDRVPTLITKINKTPINKNMGWCDDPKSKYYNKLVKFPFKYSAENLFRKDNIYDIILVLNFNMNPIKRNKGSAIFIHVAKKNLSPTKGCVAIKKKELKKIVRLISKNVKIIIS